MHIYKKSKLNKKQYKKSVVFIQSLDKPIGIVENIQAGVNGYVFYSQSIFQNQITAGNGVKPTTPNENDGVKPSATDEDKVIINPSKHEEDVKPGHTVQDVDEVKSKPANDEAEPTLPKNDEEMKGGDDGDVKGGDDGEGQTDKPPKDDEVLKTLQFSSGVYYLGSF